MLAFILLVSHFISFQLDFDACKKEGFKSEVCKEEKAAWENRRKVNE